MLIRKATAMDAKIAFDIRRLAILQGCRHHYDPKKLTIWTKGSLTDQFCRFVVDYGFVAEQDQQVVATGMLDTKTHKIEAMFVAPQYAGQGVGKKMILHLERLAGEAGIQTLTLDATLNAAPFYRSCGYVGEEIMPYYSPTGVVLASIEMSKRLS